MNDFITLSYLATFAGTVFTVNLLVQFTKDLIDRYIAKIHTRWIVFLYAEFIMFGTAYFQHTITQQNAFLIFLNGFLVALTAIGAYSAVLESPSKKDTPGWVRGIFCFVFKNPLKKEYFFYKCRRIFLKNIEVIRLIVIKYKKDNSPPQYYISKICKI